ncbi:hypothetical protein BT96DRAFT_798442, partial [Gymnopus androsaceus JB14]
SCILDGRFSDKPEEPGTAAPPIQIYDPVFGSFLKRVNDNDEVPDKILRSTAELLRSASTIKTAESPRDSENLTSADYMLAQHTPFNVNAAPIMAEVKSELGSGGSDPSVQSGFSYARFYCSPEV